jgi:hypothetical protein
MKLTTKKIIAREFLMLLVSLFLCLLAYGLDLFLEKQNDESLQKKRNEVYKYESQIDTYLNAFRKNPKVDSLYKLQMEFYSNYHNAFNRNESESGNYFFWKNLRNSISDSTFNISYARDEVVSEIIRGENENTSKLKEILWNQKFKRTGNYFGYNLVEDKFEFRYFALNNMYEKYLSKDKWEKYENIRIKKREIENEIEIAENNYGYDYLENVFILCIGLVFLLRYLVYSILWSIKILKQKNQ